MNIYSSQKALNGYIFITRFLLVFKRQKSGKPILKFYRHFKSLSFQNCCNDPIKINIHLTLFASLNHSLMFLNPTSTVHINIFVIFLFFVAMLKL